MTPAAKRFLIVYFGVYLAVSILINVTLGPPGMSEAFTKRFKQDYDRYLTIAKSEDYLRWRERPELMQPDTALVDNIAFVERFEATPEFNAEQTRRYWYGTAVDFFRFIMIAILAWYFGKAPLLRFLDNQREAIRRRIEQAESARAHAAEQQRAAMEKLAGLEDEKARMYREADARVAQEETAARESTAQSLALLEQETEDRIRHEEILAQQALKAALVDRAIAMIQEQYVQERTPERESILIDDFARHLEGAAR